MKSTHSDVMDRIVYDLCSAVDTPRSLSAWLCYKHNHLELLQLPGADFASNDTTSVMEEYLVLSYLSKYIGLSTGLNLREVALEKWFASERSCKSTNALFTPSELRGISPRVSALLFKAQRKIASIMGRFSTVASLHDCKWATGATFDLKRGEAFVGHKMTRTISVTESALPYLRKVIEHDPHWFATISGVVPDGEFCVLPCNFTVTRGSRFLTVPKSAKTDRCIAAEPTGNSFLQQGLHAYMRRRLKRFGVDLDNQARNQQRASDAYNCGFATLDLSAASDSISRNLVFHLFPIDWALLMDSLRSPETRLNGEWIRTEKFVSMGNAFCFELESLIFYALALAVCGEDSVIEVYGDDIIVEQQYASELIELLGVCGFSINVSKSYTQGNFYESCGEHYHRGKQITPIYQKALVIESSERVRAHNRLVRLGLRLPEGRLRRRIRKLSKWLISNHPDPITPLVPYGTPGDDGYLVHPLTLLSVYDKNHGFRCRVLVSSPAYKTVEKECAYYAYKLRRFSFQNSKGTGHCYNAVEGPYRYKRRWVSESDIDLTYL